MKKLTLENFMAIVDESKNVVGIPSNCKDLKSLLSSVDSLFFEFHRMGESIARAYWADGWDAETKTWQTGGCVSCLLDIESLKGLVCEAMENDETVPAVLVPVSMINDFKVNNDCSVDIYCDNGQSFSLGSDGYLYP